MGKIKVLPLLLINKIAAGEVIERPASVVKELVENAIDAHADTIEIFIEDGGKRLIRISDNGDGIAEEDMPLAFASHATSKLLTVDDLFNINTLGFRGEALASIGSISHSKVISRKKGAENGHRMEVEGGKMAEPSAEGCPEGTTIEISNIFFNTPARRKFLYSTNVEFGHILDVFTRFAISYPKIRFDITHNGNTVYQLPKADSVADRIKYFFGTELSENLLYTEKDAGSVKMRAYIGKPALTGNSAKRIFLYVNGRFIRDRMLTKAIMEAYKDIIEPRKYPYVFMFLDIPAGEIDVNVHPTKIEVRFRNISRIFDMIAGSLRECLTSGDLSAPFPVSGRPAPAPYPSRFNPSFGNGPNSQQGAAKAIVDYFIQKTAPDNVPPAGQQDRQRFQLFKMETTRCVQVHDSYIIEETPDGIVIIDQHALHESILYNDLKTDSTGNGVMKQKLLIPTVVELTGQESALYETIRPILDRLGFETGEFGKGSIAVQAVPAILKDVDLMELMHDIMEELREEMPKQKTSVQVLEEITERVIKTVACKGAIKAGRRLNEQEIEALLKRRAEVEQSAACAHGRPTTLKITLEQLEKHFHR